MKLKYGLNYLDELKNGTVKIFIDGKGNIYQHNIKKETEMQKYSIFK